MGLDRPECTSPAAPESDSSGLHPARRLGCRVRTGHTCSELGSDMDMLQDSKMTGKSRTIPNLHWIEYSSPRRHCPHPSVPGLNARYSDSPVLDLILRIDTHNPHWAAAPPASRFPLNVGVSVSTQSNESTASFLPAPAHLNRPRALHLAGMTAASHRSFPHFSSPSPVRVPVAVPH